MLRRCSPSKASLWRIAKFGGNRQRRIWRYDALGIRFCNSIRAKLTIQPQPFSLLSYLLRRHGEAVSRQELQQTLWPDDTYVEFNASLNAAIKKLRRVILDGPRNPRYIETLPRTGYRFSYPIEWIEAPAQVGQGHAGGPIETPSDSEKIPQLQEQSQTVNSTVVAGSWSPSGDCLAGRSGTWSRPAGDGHLSLTAPALERVVRRYGLSLGAGANSADGVISPDVRHVLYPVETDGRRRLMLRSLAVEEARELPGSRAMGCSRA